MDIADPLRRLVLNKVLIVGGGPHKYVIWGGADPKIKLFIKNTDIF